MYSHPGINIIFIVFLINTIEIQAQEIPATPERYFHFKQGDSVLVWNETIIPGTIIWQINGDPIDIPFELSENKIFPDFGDILLNSDSVTVRFKVLPYPFHEKVTVWDSSQIKVAEGDVFYDPIQQRPTGSLIESPGLEYDGALTRGFSLGNNQSLVFDSELNLQLGGNIGDGYEIRAAITDNNLPIQPDGTTRQLQEFDKVFIEIKKDQHSILAGDFDAIQPPGYFMRYNRKLKGAQYSYHGNRIDDPWKIRGSAAISRGNFTRQDIIPSEGNQGPYPLRGENGELFIVILAGSEKVYLDGVLLTRGEDADYIMDYNQSEITFTRNILINSRHRITVEFEYAQFNFQKSHNALEVRYEKEKLVTYFNFFQENDSKSVTGDLELTPEDLNLLQMAGDEGDQFVKSGIREAPEGYQTNSILYSLEDTLVNSILYPEVLVWSTDPQKAIYVVTFSEVGTGNGDYVISANPSPNGRVYEWVAPDPVTGSGKGNFAPIIPLQAPQQKQMLTGGGELKFGKSGILTGEIGLSRQDFNRYSSLDDDDNTGIAIKLNLQNTFSLFKRWNFTPRAGYESSGTHFRPLDPYRNPEFARDWNISQTNLTSSEHLPMAGFRIARGPLKYVQYQYDGLFRGNEYEGHRHQGQILFDTSGWKLNGQMSLMSSQSLLHNSAFLRPNITIERVLRQEGDWRIGIQYWEDKNETRDRDTDTLTSGSFLHNRGTLYLKNNPEAMLHLIIGYVQERPKFPRQNTFNLLERVSEWNVGGHWNTLKNFKLEYTLKRRSSEQLIDPSGGRSTNLLGRLDWKADLIKKAVRWNAGYEIGNGQEPKIEFKYIKVQKGEGLYTWVDDGDGIEEVNEFELAPFADEGEYIKLSVINNEFIRTRTLALQQTLNFDLKNIKATGVLSKIALTSNYQLNRKIREEEESAYWNPFYTSYPDTSVLGYTSLLRNILYWNRSSTAYDIQVGQVRVRNQLLQTSGYEIRESDDLTLRWRLSLQKKLDLVLNGRTGKRENRSQFFDTKNFTLSQTEFGPEVNFILKEKTRLTGTYALMVQDNLSGTEKFESHKFSLEAVWRKNTSTDIRAQVSLISIDYTPAGNMNVDFAMLQGLREGKNVLWNLQFNTRITKTLILTMMYHGRSTGASKVIHTGSAQVRASF